MDVLDLIGIGIGPFNLSLAALADRTELKTLFFEKEASFSWHPGLTLPGSQLQVSPLKDCVTLVDPTSRYSFLNYLAARRRLYNFANRRGGQTSRREFTDYYRWVAGQLRSLRFDEEVECVARSQGGYTIKTGGGEYKARALVVGVGVAPKVPECVRSHQGDRIYHVADFLNRPSVRPNERVLVVGGGQSGAEVVEHLLGTLGIGKVTWITSRSNLFTMDDSAFVNEAFTPTYSRRFHGLSLTRRRRIVEDEKLTSDGISAGLSNRLYDLFYEMSVEGRLETTVALLTDVRMEDVSSGHNVRYAHLRSAVTGLGCTVEVDRIVLATGFEPRSSPMIEDLLSQSRLEEGAPVLGRDYAVEFCCDEEEHQAGKLFLQNRSRVQHGLQSVNLSLVAYRNSLIINSVLGYEFYASEPDSHLLGSLDDVETEPARQAAKTSVRTNSRCECQLARSIREHVRSE